MMKDISVINSVKYAAYRTAFKLRYLQTRLKCHEISLECISAAFNKAGFLPEKNTSYISNKEIENILLICYKTTFKHKPVDTHLCTDLLLNMLINTFDENRRGKIQILKSKVFLVVMGGGRLQDKYRYLFNEIADDNHHVSRKRLAKLLLILSSMVEFLSEELYFGSSFVSGAVESCFRNVSMKIFIFSITIF
ncbi:Dystrophin, isoform E, partial [Armadillidium nasatum]